MENITIEKSFKFDYVIDKIESIEINDQLRCEINEDNSHAIGALNVSGVIITPLGNHNFNEDLEIDVYAPFDKKIDKDKFKLSVKDYSYVVNNKTLTVYIVLNMDGLLENTEEEAIEANYDEIINSMNNINDINNEEEEQLQRNSNEKVKVVENKTQEEKISSNWANELFKLNESYTVFKIIHKNSEKDN